MKKLIFTFLIGVLIASPGFSQNTLQIGDKAPDIKTIADNGAKWKSKKYKGKKFIVVYFYPAAMTGGCTKQACAYRDFQSEIESAEAIVVGVSGDNVQGLKLFKEAYDLNFPLLTDINGEIADKFGVPRRDGGTITKEINGQSFDLVRGVSTSRWTFIIDKKGEIAYINNKVDATKDTEEVLNFIKQNS